MILAPNLRPPAVDDDLDDLDDLELVEHADVVDAGLEVTDLPDDLALTAGDLAAPALAGPVTLFRSASPVGFGVAADYEPITWLPRVLRAAGVSVVEHPGWEHNGRPRSVGPFTPRGVLWHHDASAVGPSPGMARFIADAGRPDAGIPAPLAQVWVCVGCNGAHPSGTWHVLAAGRANHAGTGDGWGGIGRDAGNTATIGVEVDNTTGEKTPKAVYDSLVLGTAAILRELRSRPARWLAGHKEYAPGRKVDPDDVVMSRARRDVARTMRELAGKPRSESRTDKKTGPPARCTCPGGCTCGRGARRPRPGDPAGAPAPRPTWAPRPFPGRQHFRLDCADPFVVDLERWLIDLELFDRAPGPKYGRHTRAAVRTFQQQHEQLAGDADGFPGPITWRMIQLAARDARRRRRG